MELQDITHKALRAYITKIFSDIPANDAINIFQYIDRAFLDGAGFKANQLYSYLNDLDKYENLSIREIRQILMDLCKS